MTVPIMLIDLTKDMGPIIDRHMDKMLQDPHTLLKAVFKSGL